MAGTWICAQQEWQRILIIQPYSGFVAEFLHKSGYEVVFVDVMDKTIEALQANKSYTVTEIGEDGEKNFEITNYRAINSKYNEPQVVEEISEADTVTCAVGPNILKFIAPVIAKGIEARKLDYPLAVIACENMIGGTDALKGFIKEKLGAEVAADIEKHARFANSAIDRIVPNQDADAGLNVKIEKFYEWCVELPPFKGMSHPNIQGIHYVDDLEPYIERKLFTVNTGHATAAYYGKLAGKPYIHECLADPTIREQVRDVLKETASLIVKKHGIDQAEQDKYVNTIIGRFSNPALQDNVERVGRAPLRKLGRKERFVGPAAQLAEMGMPHTKLVEAMEKAFQFVNIPGDDESAQLASILKENDADGVVTKVTGLDKDHALYPDVLKVVQKVKGSS